jgi:hypothetical protein
MTIWTSSLQGFELDLFEKLQELDRSVALVALANDKPRGNIESSKQGGRTMPHVAVRATFRTPGIIGKTGWSRSSA